MKLSQIEVDACRLQVAAAGETHWEPPWLLVHGFPLNHTLWRRQFALLSERHHVLAPDLRGFGGSPEPDPGEMLAMARFADDLAGLLDALDVPQAVLCGLSMGGYIALEFWNRHRDRLAGLVFCDTKPGADPEMAKRQRLQMADEVVDRGAEAVAESMPGKLLSSASRRDQPELFEEVRGMIRATAPAVIAAAQRGMAARSDFSDRLGEIDCPTLLLCGAEDALSPPEVMRAMADGIPNSVYVEIPAAGHLAPLEQPQEVNAALADFRAQLT